MSKLEYINYWKFAPISTRKLKQLEKQEGLKRLKGSEALWLYEENTSRHMKILRWTAMLSTFLAVAIPWFKGSFRDFLMQSWVTFVFLFIPLAVLLFITLEFIIGYLLCLIFLRDSDIKKSLDKDIEF